MLIIGIDPEPTGAFSFWDTKTGRIFLEESSRDYPTRTERFLNTLNTFDASAKETHVFIEEAKLYSGKGRIKTFELIMTSYGVWLGILEVQKLDYIINSINIVPPKDWKKVFGLTKDKLESVARARGLINAIEKESNLNKGYYTDRYLVTKRGEVRKKQVEDRAEAFLIGVYGYDYIIG